MPGSLTGYNISGECELPDLYLSDVIDRADKIMYANKTILKARINSNL